jgi:hypothetical protein
MRKWMLFSLVFVMVGGSISQLDAGEGRRGRRYYQSTYVNPSYSPPWYHPYNAESANRSPSTTSNPKESEATRTSPPVYYSPSSYSGCVGGG